MIFIKRFPKKRVISVFVLVWFAIAYAKTKRHSHQPVSGKLDGREMNEISDMVASGIYADTYYVHNDSGDTSRFFAITPAGRLKATFYFNGDPDVRDCEDAAVGPGPEAGQSYFYLGDIGDNSASRSCIKVYRINEAQLMTDSVVHHVKAVPVTFKYPDGPKDAETMMIDPVEKLLYIVSKRKASVKIYTTPLLYKAGDTITLTARGELHFKGLQPLKWIVSGDVSHDGSQVLIKSYVKVYYWKRTGQEPLWQTLQHAPTELPYEQEKQGEAIGFATDGKSYYTTSEGLNAPIYHYSIP